MPGPLKNTRQEKFCHELAQGKSQLEAYVAAGYKPDDGAACRLSGNVRVIARLAELQKRTAEKATTTAADIARQLDEDREFARKVEHAPAAVAATLGKAKVLGLIIDKAKIDHGGAISITVTSEDAAL